MSMVQDTAYDQTYSTDDDLGQDALIVYNNTSDD